MNRREVLEEVAAGRLAHDHIVPIYGFGEDGDRHFFSMRYVEGRSLAGLLRDGPLPGRRAAALTAPLARALAYAAAAMITGFAAIVLGLGLTGATGVRKAFLHHPAPILLTLTAALAWWGALAL